MQQLPIHKRTTWCTEMMKTASLDHYMHELQHPTDTELLPSRLKSLDEGRPKVQATVEKATVYIDSFRALQLSTRGEVLASAEQVALASIRKEFNLHTSGSVGGPAVRVLPLAMVKALSCRKGRNVKAEGAAAGLGQQHQGGGEPSGAAAVGASAAHRQRHVGAGGARHGHARGDRSHVRG